MSHLAEMDYLYLLLRGEDVRGARFPDDHAVLSCLKWLGVGENLLLLRQVNEFNAPGVFEQYHFAAGDASTGMIKVEEDERGAGRGQSYLVFRRSEPFELYLSTYSGNGGELTVLCKGEGNVPNAARRLVEDSGLPWPRLKTADTAGEVAERIALHQNRLTSLSGNISKWLGRPVS